jgi:hypothetical protein
VNNVIGPPSTRTTRFNFGIGRNIDTGFSFGFGSNFSNQCKECTTQATDGFKCATNQTHIFCSACNIMMPNRIQDTSNQRPQQCKFCDKYFCGAYYGCRATNNRGSLKTLKGYQMVN